MKYCIRLAEVKDKNAILALMKEHAVFEGHELVLSRQEQQLNSLATLPLTIFVVELKSTLVGYTSVIKQFSTWDMDWYLYLDCLYLNEQSRGQGIGLKLMQKLRCFSQENKINTMQWQTPNSNVPAINFYQKLGAKNKDKQRFFWHF